MSQATHHRQALMTLYMAAILLACNGLFAKAIPLNSTSISQTRSVIAVVALLLLYALRRESIRLPSLKAYLSTYFLGLLLGLHWITFFGAMQVSTVAIGMVSLFSYPVMTVILEAAFNKERPKISDIIAGFIVLLGVFILMPETNASGAWQLNQNTVIGISLSLFSALIFALRNTLQTRLLTGINSSGSTLHQFLIIAIVLSPFVEWRATLALPAENIFQLVLLGVITTALAHSLLVASLRHLSAKSVAMIGCIQPPMGALLAWWVLSEQPTLQVILGGTIILSVALYETWQSR